MDIVIIVAYESGPAQTDILQPANVLQAGQLVLDIIFCWNDAADFPVRRK